MRDLEKLREKREFSLGNRELALVFSAFLLLLVLSFALGVMAGRGLKGVVLVQQPMPLDGNGVTVPAAPAPREIAGAPATVPTGSTVTATVPTAGTVQYTFYETLTKSPAPAAAKPEKSSAPAASPPAIHQDKGGKFTIQLSSSQEKGKSSRRVEELKKKGYPAYLEGVDITGKGTWYRVKVGHFMTREDATRYALSMRRKEGISSFVIVAGD